MKSILTTVLVGFLTINVGVLYYIVLLGDVPQLTHRLDLLERRVDSVVKRDEQTAMIPEVQVGESLVVLSDQQKQELVDGALAAAQVKISEIIEQQVSHAKGQIAGVREYYIPLGRASAKSADNIWQNTSLQAEIDTSNYSDEAKFYFEGSLYVPTGNGFVEARLVDVEAGEVQGSVIKAEGYEPSFVESQPLSLSGGKRKLVLQMRTSMDYEGVLENGRLRVVIGEEGEKSDEEVVAVN